MTAVVRNRYAGNEFHDDDEALAALLDDVSIPVLLCSLVHMTGDPSWIRDRPRLRVALLADRQGGMTDEEQAAVRSEALTAVTAYRDAGCPDRLLGEDVVEEMMTFLVRKPVRPELMPVMLEELAIDGADHRRDDRLTQLPGQTRSDHDVIVIGAGMSGVLAGIRLRQAGLPFTLIDKNPGPGGTWWENRYPGARVDVFSHCYSYSFESGEHWSESFCRQPELRDYFDAVLDRHQLRAHCRFDTAVGAVRWDEEDRRWHVTTRTADGHEDKLSARFVISTVGALNLPMLPDITGMDEFDGPSFHSIRWPEDLDVRGKHVALVGAGASGFQIAPTIAADVARLDIYQRTPQWIFPNPVYHDAVPAGERWAMRHLPLYARWFRFVTMYPGIALGPRPYRIDPEYDDPAGLAVNAANAERRREMVEWMTKSLDGRPDLVEKSIPDYPAMAKRILQDNGSWLKMLLRDNVELIRTPIDRVTRDGVVTADGELREADVICYATGFAHNDFLASIDVTGRDGESLRAKWGDAPTAYLGMTVPSFPNLFCMYGPGTNLAHGASLFFHSECQIRYVMDAIRHVIDAGATTIEVRESPYEDYAQRYSAEMSRLVWSHPSIAHSHYKNQDGQVFTLSPWPLDEYWEWTKNIKPSDYIVDGRS